MTPFGWMLMVVAIIAAIGAGTTYFMTQPRNGRAARLKPRRG